MLKLRAYILGVMVLNLWLSWIWADTSTAGSMFFALSSFITLCDYRKLRKIEQI